MSPAQPARLGRYEIVRALARGGMAELYLARLPGIEGFAKQVVIKRVLPELARDREFVDMLLAEARLAAQLDHQNIVHVSDVGHDAGGYFFVMELLHGADVATMLRTAIARDGGLPLGIALEIARGACAGLHYAHERVGPDGAPLGLVHRDVSPQNLFVTFDGAVKLLDFGIARAVEKLANHYTRSGTLRGKVPYMSPEQCQAEALDRRSDVFSLAIVLWEMTVGERLFGGAGESDFAVLKAIIEHDAPAPSARRPGYPPALEAIVLRGLRRARAERYPSADAMHAALDAFAREHALWTSPRDVAGYMAELFPDAAAAWHRSAHERGADVAPQVRHTAPLPATPATAALPPAALPAALPASLASMPASPASMPAMMPETSAHPAASAPRGPDPSAPAPRSRAPWIALVAGGVALALGAGYLLGRAKHDAGARGAVAPAAAGSTPAAASPASAGSPAVASPAASASTPAATAPTAPAPDAPSVPPPPPAEDVHFLRGDDYLVHESPFRDGRLDRVRVAKLLEPPSRPGARARFLDGKGRELVTEAYWRTRVASPADLVLGRFAFCRVDPFMKEAHAPRDREEARTRTWALAKVTDVAEVDAGWVMVGPIACDVDGVRVPIE